VEEPLPSALGVAAALVEHSRRFREAAAARSAVLTAVERFYLDLLECQWRLEALESMLLAVSSAVGEAPFLGRADGERADGPERPEARPGAEEEWRRDAMERCLFEIDAQQHRATEALEERAESYCTGVLASSGLIERLATGDGERQRANERLTRLVASIFAEIMCEARELTAASSSLLPLYLPTLRRRQEFWQRQLEETWAAWESATAGMHEFGHHAVAAWIELSDAVRAGRSYCGGRDCAGQVTRTLLLNALAEAAAQSLEVELLNSLGLAGLDCEAVGAIASAEDEACPSRSASCCLDAEEWSAMRASLLRSVLQLLDKAGVLCDAELRVASEWHHVGH